MITEYSPEFKESMLQKIFFNPNRSVVSFTRVANIPDSTVATWVRNYKKKNGEIMGQGILRRKPDKGYSDTHVV